MSLLANVPTLSYISWKNMIITYKETTYQIENSHTNKAYIYWDSKNPYLLTTSNVKLEPRNGLFYIIFNKSGTYTVVPNDDIEIDFSENPSRSAITNRIVGLSNDTKDKFVAVQIDIDGIKFDVYDTEGKFSKFEQRVDKIDLEVKGVEKKYSNDPQLTKMREDFNEVLLSLQATLGLFSSDMNTYMEDNKLTTEEKNKINAYKSSLEQKRVELNNHLNTVVEYLNKLEDVDKARIVEVNASMDGLNTAFSNLFTNIDAVCVDNVFTNTEITAIVSYFGKANLAINECKNTVDYMFLGVGGFLIEEVSSITLEQDNIKLEVKRVENHINTEVSRIELKQNEITLEVRNEVAGLNSKITQTADSLTSTINNEVAGLNSKITQTADSLTTNFTNEDKKLQSQITQTAEQLTTSFTNADKGLESKITQTADSLTTSFTNADKAVESKITQTANSLTTSFTNADKGLQSQITQNANAITQRVTSSDFESYKTQTAKEISSKVSSGDLSTIVKQNATSWGLSINGKLSGSTYTFDGTNFSIGSTTTANKAFHNNDYSRWQHSDGSYTQINSGGLKRYVSGTGKSYFYYTHVGEVNTTSWDEVTIPLPAEISEKVGTNYSVAVSIRWFNFENGIDTSWINVAVAQLCVYVHSKTSKSFKISTFKTGINVHEQASSVIEGGMTIQYTIIA